MALASFLSLVTRHCLLSFNMKIAFVIYDRMTALDFIGAFDPLTRLKTMKIMPAVDWEICAFTETVVDGAGLRFTPSRVAGSLEEFDLLVVPGGYGSRELARDDRFIDWLKTSAGCGLKTSVCTGSVLLGAAGFLKEKRATTHRKAFDELRPFCREVVDKRIVDEDDVITAQGVASSIDLGLYLCEKLAGRDAKERIRQQMEYPLAQ